jgi:hypothetical protein
MGGKLPVVNNFYFDIALAVGQSPAGKKVRTQAEDIVESRHQATTNEDATD